MVYRHMIDRALGHSLVESGLERLDDGHTAALLDRQQTGRAVVQVAGQNHADDPWSIAVGSGAKERIDGWPVSVFLGTTGQPEVAVAQQEMTVGRSDVDSAGLDGLAVASMVDRQGTRPAQNPR